MLSLVGFVVHRTLKPTRHGGNVNARHWHSDPVVRVGSILRGYDIEEKIGQGGSAEIFRARHLETGQRCAIKILKRSNDARSRNNRRRFQKEAWALTRLYGKPGIVRILENWTEEYENPHMVLELLNGLPLSSCIQTICCFPVTLAAPIAIKILEVLATVHQYGILHKDLKPANILLLGDGSIRLLDFGITDTEVGKAPKAIQNLSEQGMVVGTPQYMSPEVAHNRTCDRRSDIYIVGILLFEMLVGVPPFRGGGIECMIKQCTAPIPRLPDLHPLSGGPIEELMRRALAKEPEKRPRSAPEMARLLRFHLRTLEAARKRRTI